VGTLATLNFAHRWDFGFWNPNAAGAFFAVLVFAVFLLPGQSRPAKAFKIFLALVLFIAVLLTASRAALLGLVIGGFASWFLAGRSLPLKNGLVWLLSLLLLMSCLFLGSKSFRRISEISTSEPSTASRLTIYSKIPSMLLAAPGGWGQENAARAYENWFQDSRDTTGFKNLLSTHGTWAVEWGMGFLVCYIALWCVALWVCTPLAFGALTCWGICAALSHVGVFWWMWAIPVLVVLASLWSHGKNSCFPGFSKLICLSAAAFLTLGASFWLALSGAPAKPVRFSNNVLIWGDGSPSLWLVRPDPAVFGKAPGKSLTQLENFAVVEDWNEVPIKATAVISGNAPPTPPPGLLLAHLHWLTPPGSLSPDLVPLLTKTPRKSIWNGSERQDVPIPPWRPWFESLHGASWHQLPGRTRFLGDDLGNLTKSSH
jgi:hypothetical protein